MNRFALLFDIASAFVFAQPGAAQESLPTSRAAVDPSVRFPEIERATRPQGAFVEPRRIAMVTRGMKKSQLYTLLDVPHFHEGLFGVRRWNYIFNFYTGTGDEYRTCQYQIHFDGQARVDGTWWRTEECAALFSRLLDGGVAAGPVAIAQPRAEKATAAFDLLFDFDSAAINPAAQAVIREAAAQAVRVKPSRIVVVGFTDTMGAVSYNDALAARRAAAVESALVHALPSGETVAGNIFSRGGRDLAVQTVDEVREGRNRRVIIEFHDR